MKIDRSGFTVVELMVSVVIVSVLAAVAVPLYSNYQAQARQAEVKTSLASAFATEKGFYLQNQHYTGCLAAAGYAPESQYYTTGFDSTSLNSGTGLDQDCYNACKLNINNSNPQCVQQCALKLSYTLNSNSGYCFDNNGQTYFSATIPSESPAVNRSYLLVNQSVIRKDNFTVLAAGRPASNLVVENWQIDQDKNLVMLNYTTSNGVTGAVSTCDVPPCPM